MSAGRFVFGLVLGGIAAGSVVFNAIGALHTVSPLTTMIHCVCGGICAFVAGAVATDLWRAGK